jgi:probable Rubsico expression protein CbbX
MGRIRIKTSTTIVSLTVIVGLVVVWFALNHLAFGIVFGCVLLVVPLALFLRDSLRQTSAESLAARGITPESVRQFDAMDGGLRREIPGLIPMAVTRRIRGTDAWKFAHGRHMTPAGAAVSAARMTTPAPRPAPARKAEPAKATKTRQEGSKRRAKESPLPPDATVTLAEERRAAGIDDLFAELDKELIGLVPVKKKVEEIGSLLLVDRARQRFGLSASRPNLHMSFTGAPGTGKTTVALKMADLLRRLGYLEKGHLVHAMRDDLVGEYIGQTAPRTHAVLERAMGGVLFIDEAYNLFRSDDSKDYGQECIDILMQVMENDRDKLVVILAGYKDRMEHFFDSNPGMSSRIAHHLDFPDYELDELLAIGRLMLNQTSYYLSPDATLELRDHLSVCMRQPRFGNARTVRNELERARLRHAYRLAADPERGRTKDELMRLEAEDVTLSQDYADR